MAFELNNTGESPDIHTELKEWKVLGKTVAKNRQKHPHCRRRMPAVESAVIF